MQALQAHLNMQNTLIHYIPRTSHSLNLVDINGIDDYSEEATSFLYLSQSLYTFCRTSTHLWNRIYHDNYIQISLTLKSLCDTRWSCRANSPQDLHENLMLLENHLQKFLKIVMRWQTLDMMMQLFVS